MSTRTFELFELCVVVGAAVAVTFLLGAIWSYVRIGTVSAVFVREAQFVLGLVALVVWTIRNRSGGSIEEAESADSVPIPASSTRVALYRRLTGEDVTAARPLDADIHMLGFAGVLIALSIGVELLV